MSLTLEPVLHRRIAVTEASSSTSGPPDAELHLFDTGRFALEEHVSEIAAPSSCAAAGLTGR